MTSVLARALRLAAAIDEQVVQDHDQPGARDAAIVVAITRPQGPYVGVLDEVVGRGGVAAQPERDAL